jgi:hypothetical protein
MKYLSIPVIILTVILSIGCGHSNLQISDLEDKSCYPNPIHQLLFSYGLNKEKIIYRTDGKGCFYTKDTDQEKVNHIQEVVFGKSPPLSLRIARGKNSNSKLVKLLKKHGIKTYRVIFFGDEYIAWNAKDTDQVESLLDLSREQLNHMRKTSKH